MAEAEYKYRLSVYAVYDTYSGLDDWTISEADEPGSGRLRGSPYTLIDNNVLIYWVDDDDDGFEEYEKEPLVAVINIISREKRQIFVVRHDDERAELICLDILRGHDEQIAHSFDIEATNMVGAPAYVRLFECGIDCAFRYGVMLAQKSNPRIEPLIDTALVLFAHFICKSHLSLPFALQKVIVVFPCFLKACCKHT